MKAKATLTIGTRFQYDGQPWTVSGFIGSSVQSRSHQGRTAVHDIAFLTASDGFKVLDDEEPPALNALTTFPDNVPEVSIRRAETILAHLNEAECGYKSGNRATAQPDEPRFEYDPDGTTLKQRIEAKSKETGIAVRTLWELKANYKHSGIYALVDRRQLNSGRANETDHRVVSILRQVLAEHRDKSNVTRKRIIALTEQRLQALYPDEKVHFPSSQTMYRMVERETRGSAAFKSAKRRRSDANRPVTPYRQQEASRPGEFILIDSTPFDAFALDPVTFKWIQLQFTIALDLFSRSIVGWRFTPVSTKAVDAALLLYDIIRPKLMQPGWPQSARWAYLGVPENIVVNLVEDTPEVGIAAVPLLHPETIVVDHGKVFISRAFKDACARLGINLQLARTYTPTDKGQVERAFRTIRQDFIEALPGYKGPDVYSRGLDIEDDAFYFLDEIDAKFAEWVASTYQRRNHEGLSIPGLPLLKVSPNEMYEEGIARAGFVHVVASELMYYELLPTEWRTVQHYGVELRGLRYNGDILNDYRNTKSPWGGVHAGKWPIRYDPRDLSRVFFFDDYSSQWYELLWTHDCGDGRPFNESSLSFAKALLIKRHGNPNDVDELAEAMNGLLDRMRVPSKTDRKERRLAAINAMHAQLARRDQPGNKRDKPAPDDEVPLVSEGPIQGGRTIFVEKKVQDGGSDEIVPLRTIDEAMEDDDDNLDF
jgi:transposase InsO family protein